MAVVWHEDPMGQSGPQASCKGCEESLWHRGGRWADEAGIEVCVKAPPEVIGHGQRPDYVFHEPMPAGLRGSPAV